MTKPDGYILAADVSATLCPARRAARRAKNTIQDCLLQAVLPYCTQPRLRYQVPTRAPLEARGPFDEVFDVPGKPKKTIERPESESSQLT